MATLPRRSAGGPVFPRRAASRRPLYEGDRNGEPSEALDSEGWSPDWGCVFCLLVAVACLAVSAAVVVVALLD